MGIAEPITASQTLQLLVVYVPHDFDHNVTHDLERDSTDASSVLQKHTISCLNTSLPLTQNC